MVLPRGEPWRHVDEGGAGCTPAWGKDGAADVCDAAIRDQPPTNPGVAPGNALLPQAFGAGWREKASVSSRAAEGSSTAPAGKLTAQEARNGNVGGRCTPRDGVILAVASSS